jgi:demethylmenaquinone methyltransferase/2-methoxy-6-polyprenyl-1,4-benzoquinol methylase
VSDPRTGSARRSRRLYDWWAEHAPLYGVVARLSRPLREEAVDALGLTGGETVLDVGCGPGTNFGLLRDAVGPGGRVVGMDHSRGMVERARERARPTGWENTTVVRGDATRLPVADDRVDAAVATLALTAMPDAEAVARGIRRALVPGGRVAVMDATLGRDDHPLAAWLLGPVYRRVADWSPDVDVLAALRSTFDDVEVIARHDAGTTVVALARA